MFIRLVVLVLYTSVSSVVHDKDRPTIINNDSIVGDPNETKWKAVEKTAQVRIESVSSNFQRPEIANITQIIRNISFETKGREYFSDIFDTKRDVNKNKDKDKDKDYRRPEHMQDRKAKYRKSKANEFPYAVYINHSHASGGEVGCSGTLLSAIWVITAAQCLLDFGKIVVYAGGYSKSELENIQKGNSKIPKGAQINEAKDVSLYPKLSLSSENLEIGLIKLKRKFKLTNTVNVAQISTERFMDVYLDGDTSCSVTSFGKICAKTDSPDDYFRKTRDFKVENPCVCHNKLRNVLNIDRDKFICAKPKDAGLWLGDSGAGVVCGDLLWAVTIKVVYIDFWTCEVTSGMKQDCRNDTGLYTALPIFETTFPALRWINVRVKLFTKEQMAAFVGSASALSATWFIASFNIVYSMMVSLDV